MKRFLLSVLSLVLAVCLSFAAVSCGSSDVPPDNVIDSETGIDTENVVETVSDNDSSAHNNIEITKRAKENSDEALKGEYAAFAPENCVGKYRSLAQPTTTTLMLTEEGIFSLWSPISSNKTELRGSYSTEGNKLIMRVEKILPSPDFAEVDSSGKLIVSVKSPEEFTLSFEFLNEDVLVFHAADSSDLTAFVIYWTDDIAFAKEVR